MLNLTDSQIDYLKAIYEVSLKGNITVTKIAEYLNFSKPSVVRALKNLSDLKVIIYNHDDIHLTDLGLKYVNNILRKDSILQTFFTEVLRIDKELAKKDSENIKKAVSCYTITQLERYLKQVLNKDIEEYDNYCICNQGKCSDCEKED